MDDKLARLRPRELSHQAPSTRQKGTATGPRGFVEGGVCLQGTRIRESKSDATDTLRRRLRALLWRARWYGGRVVSSGSAGKSQKKLGDTEGESGHQRGRLGPSQQPGMTAPAR